MGRSWQFLAVVAIIVGTGMYFYYSSDFYAERAAGGPAAAVPGFAAARNAGML